MRVLFVANPEKAHLLAMVPLAWALRTAGHEVRVAAAPWFCPAVTQAGLTAVPVGRDSDLWDQLRRAMPDWRYRPAYGLPAPYDVAEDAGKATWAHLHDGYERIVREWHKPACFPMMTGLVAFARAWRPDLVLWEPLAMAGPVAAVASGAAHGRLLWSYDAFGRTRTMFLEQLRARPAEASADPLGQWLGGYARRHGQEFDESMATGEFTVDQLPASLSPDDALPRLRMRFEPYGGPAVVPRWLWRQPDRPRVALTLGVSATEHADGYEISVRTVLDSLADLDIEIVATLPAAEQAKLGRTPGNVRLVEYVPLQALAPTCSAVIHHAGFGTFLTMARHPVPQLLLPWDFDGPVLAREAERQGGALAVRADLATAASVRAAVLRLLGEPVFAERAAALRDELAALPGPHAVVARLEEHAGRRRVAA